MPAAYHLIIQPSVRRDVKPLPKDDLRRILRRIESLVNNPRPPGSIKIADPALYRLRQGHYRIIYEVDDSTRTVTVFKIGHRREVYR